MFWSMWEMPVLLVLVGVLSALAGVIISFCIEQVTYLRLMFIGPTPSYYLLAYMAFTLAAAAAANFVTQVCRNARVGRTNSLLFFF